MEIAGLHDIIQQCRGNLEIPEIRVWCHPHKINKSGDDYWEVFPSFDEAMKFIGKHPEAEDQPLIAFRGWEINLWTIDEVKSDENKIHFADRGRQSGRVGTRNQKHKDR